MIGISLQAILPINDIIKRAGSVIYLQVGHLNSFSFSKQGGDVERLNDREIYKLLQYIFGNLMIVFIIYILHST